MNVISRMFKCSLRRMEYYLAGYRHIKLVKEYKKNRIKVGSMIVDKATLFIRESNGDKYQLIIREDSDSGDAKLTKIFLTKEELIVVKESIEDILEGKK